MTDVRALPNPGHDRLDYVGVKACGCTVAWCASDIPKRDLAKILAEWIRDGLSVERCTTDESRTRLRSCECKEVPSPQAPQERLEL